MNTQLNRKSLCGYCGQIIARLVVALIVFCFSNAPHAQAQSGGPGKSWGVVKEIDDARLEIRNTNGHTETFVETDQTQWLNKKGQPIDAGDVVGKNVEVRWRWITGGSEALSVQLTSGRSSGSVSFSSEGSRSNFGGGSSFAGNWRNPENGHTLKITVNGDTAVLDHNPGSPDQGTIRGNVIYFEGFARSNGKLNKAKGSVSLSNDGTRLTLQDALFNSNGDVSETR